MSMTLITKNTDYAIRALCFLAEHQRKTVSALEISRALEVSYSFLRKIMQALHKGGILRSTKGKGGGFSLSKMPDEIFVMTVIDIFQGPILMKNCAMQRSICPNLHHCALRNTIESIEKYARSTLQSVTIGSLLEEERHLDRQG